jgi:hypothetical protein
MITNPQGTIADFAVPEARPCLFSSGSTFLPISVPGGESARHLCSLAQTSSLLRSDHSLQNPLCKVRNVRIGLSELFHIEGKEQLVDAPHSFFAEP